MIEARHAQRSFGDGFITAEIQDLREPWMAHVDAVLADEAMVSVVHQALVQRHPQSRRRGRPGFPAEVVLRLLILKHIRNWSYAILEREVRANLVYRDFTRVGAAKMPDAKTMGRWGVAMGPTVIHQIHDRIVQIARAHDVVQGRRMRVDTTVAENNIHYPTDSSLLGDGVRVLTRTMRKIAKLTGEAGAKLRDRSRGVGLRLLEIARAARGKAPPSQAKMKLAYGRLLNATGRVVGQAKRFSKEITTGVKCSLVPARQAVLEGHRQLLDEMLPRVQQVIPSALSGHWFCPGASGEGGDPLGHLHQLVPGVATCLDDGVIAVPDTVTEEVAAHELPDVFHGVQFRRVGRQRQQHDVVGHIEPRRAVPARAVEHQQGDGADGDAATNLGHMLVHGRDIDLRHDDGGTDTALRTDRPEQIGPFKAPITRGARA